MSQRYLHAVRQTILGGVLCAGACAPFTWAEGTDDEELAALMALLEEETELATQTRMNTDYVPGMMTVLYARDLAAQGFSNLADALSFVSGFYLPENNAGDYRTIVRGVGATLSSSNLKFLLDGMVVNRATDASADWLMRLPLEQIERVEIIRGPGAALYGEFAFSGVVNVITRQDKVVAVKAGDPGLRQGGAYFSGDVRPGISLNVAVTAWDQGNSGLETQEDNFARRGNGYSPGKVYDHEAGQILSLHLAGNGYELDTYYASTERGPGYGYLAALPYETELREETASGIRLGKAWYLSPDLELAFDVSHQATRLDDAAYLPIPAGVRPPGASQPLQNDGFRQDGNSDTTQRARLTSHWNATENHQVYSEISISQSRVNDSFFYVTPAGGEPQEAPEDRRLVTEGAERSLTSIAIQDQWQATEDLQVTLGARFDDYDDWGAKLSPRLAGVWRVADNHIVKAQYAEAFRPPTLKERYSGEQSFAGGEDLTEEKLRSFEAAYIYRAPGHTLRTTAFYTKVDDLIEFYLNPGEVPVWRNRGNIDTRGLELEWQQVLGRHWHWQANLSYARAFDRLDEDKKLLGSVELLANAAMTWNATDRVSHSLTLTYTGAQEGWESPPGHRDVFAAYTLFGYALEVDRLWDVDGLLLTLAARNLADRYYQSAPAPAQYPDGLSHGGRSVHGALEYRF